jgi:xanthine dehydrogenase accessory factor
MDGLGVFERMSELARSGQAFALATVVWRQGPSSSKQGSRAIITSDGQLHGWIGGACAEPVVIREARQIMADGNPKLLLLGSPDQFGSAVPDGMTVVPISCQSEGALQVYIEPVLPVPHLVIVGTSPMAQTLAELARALDWLTDLVSQQEFTEGRTGQQSASQQSAGQQWADTRTMVVVATQGHGDEDMIERAAALRPAYLGLVASRRRAEAVLGYLAERGVPQDQLDRVHAPAGLDLGRTSHEEMAVAILAELVQLRASGALANGPAHVSAHVPAHQSEPGLEPGLQLALAEALDPVCGMTVQPGASAMPLEHDGLTYYFCCAGCHRAFEENPDAYAKAVLT